MASEKMSELSFSLGTDLSALEDLAKEMEALSQSCRLSARDLCQIRLALDELVTNSVSYGFSSGRGSGIDVAVTVTADRVCRITYKDDAPPFNPLSHEVPPGQSSTEAVGFGGMGLALVKKVMSNISYEHEDGKNVIRMERCLDDKE